MRIKLDKKTDTLYFRLDESRIAGIRRNTIGT